jgi:hypothetical protein
MEYIKPPSRAQGVIHISHRRSTVHKRAVMSYSTDGVIQMKEGCNTLSRSFRTLSVEAFL